ncbi:MAG: DMT family transporter [Candidatus Thorarchaeota archaeon]|nr:MAG: DMT family transporter [Candidatus Thorarchaeota archaeon]
MQSSTDLLIGSAIGLIAAFLWAVATNVYQSQSDEATPLAISTLKTWMSLAVMAVLVMLPFRTTPFFIPFNAIIYLAASVTIGLIIGDIAYLTSQERIGVSYAFPIAATFPISTYIIAIFVVDEVILWTRFVGIMLAVVGVILVSRAQASTSNDEENTSSLDRVGLLLALFSALCWSVGSVLLQIGVAEVDPIDANFVRMIFGAGIIAPLFLGSVRRGMPKPTRKATKIILVAAFFGMAWGSLLYTYAVKMIGASVASVLGSISPLFALPISIVFLKEKVTFRSILGILLTVSGVILVVLIV